MSRRRGRKPCPVTGKVSYRDREAAEWGTAKIYRTSAFVSDLYVYDCPDCPGWHTTSTAGRGSYPVARPADAQTRHIEQARAQAQRVRAARRVLDTEP